MDSKASKSNSRRAAAKQLRASENKDKISDVRPPASGLFERLQSAGLGEEMAYLASELALLFGAGLTVPEGLAFAADRPEQGRLYLALARVRQGIIEGSSFSDACAADASVFEGAWVAAVRLGESSGDLSGALRSYSEQKKRQVELWKKMVQAAAYPLFLMVVLGAIALLLGLFVLPRFAKMYSDFGAALPLPTQWLLKGVAWFPGLVGVAAVLVACLVALWHRSGRDDEARIRRDGFLLELPIVGKVLLEAGYTRAAQALRALLDSGATVPRAMLETAAWTGNAKIQADLRGAAARIAAGASMSESLRACAAPPALVNFVAAGERSGTLAALLGQAADLLGARLERRMARLGSVAEPALVLVAGLLVGLVVVALYLPIFKLGSVIR
jgi:type IV pilus assembly protein PilC